MLSFSIVVWLIDSSKHLRGPSMGNIDDVDQGLIEGHFEEGLLVA